MGRIVPRCFATNSDSIYFIARTARSNTRGKELDGPRLVTLVKSNPYPTSINDTKWTVVSISTENSFARFYNRHYNYGTLTCSVDDNGVFTFTGPNINGRSVYRFDPLAPKSPSRNTTTTGSTTGEWVQLNVSNDDQRLNWSVGDGPDPLVLFNVNGSNSTNNTAIDMPKNESQSIQMMALWDFWGRKTQYWSPTIEISTFNSTGQVVDSKYATLFTGNGTVNIARYSDGKIWAVMETGYPFKLPEYVYPQHNKTLAVIPFSYPYQPNPASIVRIPWDLNCYEADVQSFAAYNGTLYYICSTKGGGGQLTKYDYATNITLAPVSVESICTRSRSLTLVPNKPGVPYPAFALIAQGGERFATMDFNNNNSCTPVASNERTPFVVDELLQEPKPEPAECLETCTEMRALTWMFVGCALGGLFIMVCCCWNIRRCVRQRKRREQLAAAATVEPTPAETSEQPFALQETGGQSKA
ncbi:hypothetical protein BG004_006568 [Podila humilis]|nr:hypothetical protein BG004_006568 [Podila humilis]